MPKITVRREGALVATFTVSQKTFVLGSAQNCAVAIQDVGLPPQAAEITAGESGFTLRRLSPIPDIRLNGERVDKYVAVQDMDEIRLDDYSLIFNLLPDEQPQLPEAPTAPPPAAPEPFVAEAPPPAPVAPPPPPPAPEPPAYSRTAYQEAPAPPPPPPPPTPPPPPPPLPAYPKTVMHEAPRMEPPKPAPAPRPEPPPQRQRSSGGRKTKILGESEIPQARPHYESPSPPPPMPARGADREATQFAGHALSERLALMGIGGPLKGERFLLRDGETKIGRDPNQNDIVVRFDVHGDVDTSVSRQHCVITGEGGRYILRDPKSKTRTMYNGRVLKPEDGVVLQVGDTIEIRSLHENTSFRVVREGEWDVPSRVLHDDEPRPSRKVPWWKRLISGGMIVVALSLVAYFWATAGTAPDDAEDVSFAAGTPWPAPTGIESATGAFLTLGDSVVLLAYADADGNVRWVRNGEAYRAPLLGLKASPAPFLAMDVNADFNADLVLASSDDHVYFYDGLRGARLAASEWLAEPFAVPPAGTYAAAPTALVAAHSDRGKLAVYRADNAQVFRPEFYYNGRTFGAGSFFDCNGDGTEDYVVGTDEGQVNWVDGNSGEMETVDLHRAVGDASPLLASTTIQIRAPIAGYDYTADGQAEWLILTRQGNLLVYDRRRDQVLAWHTFPQEGPLPSKYPGPMLADMDKDRIPELITAHTNGSLYVFRTPRTAGGPFSEFWPASKHGSFKYEPALADLNGDRTPEIIASDGAGYLIVTDGISGSVLHRANIAATGSPLVADVDADGDVEILVPAGSQWAVVTTDASASAARQWLQWRGDVGRHGRFQTPEPVRHKPWISTVILGVVALAGAVLWAKL